MSHKIFRSFFVLVLVIGSVVTPAPQPVHAAGPWYVTPIGDDTNDCFSPVTACATINGAIGKASSGDTVYVEEGTYTSSGTEVVLIDRDITLSGGWDANFTAQTNTSVIDGQDTKRGIVMNSDVTATVDRFTIQNGLSADGGGGIINLGGTLTLNKSIVSNNQADCGISCDVYGGGIYNAGSLTTNESSINDNTADGPGGGIFNYGGVLTLNSSTVAGNRAGDTFWGGGIYGNGTINLNNSTISSNIVVNGAGGGIFAWQNGPTVVNLNNTTVTENSAYQGAGIAVDPTTVSPFLTVSLQNTIVAGNNGPFGPDCWTPPGVPNTIISSGYNIISITSGCDFTPSTGDLLNIEPAIGPFQDNGGPTFTHALLPGSLAINAGNPAGCTDQNGNLLTTDQRGVARPQGMTCDMGAFEFEGVVTLPANDNFADAEIVTLPFTATVDITYASIEPGEYQNCGSMNKTVWYSLTPTETMSIRVSMPPGNGFMHIYRSTGTGIFDLEHLQCFGPDNYATFLAEAGQTYYLQAGVGSFYNGTLQIDVRQAFPPANDSFANAETITSFPFSTILDVTDVGIEPGEPQGCSFMYHTVWYAFTPSETMSIRANTQSNNGFMNIYRANGSGISDVQLLSCMSFGSPLNFLAEAGQTYYFQVGFAFGEGTAIQVDLQQIFPPANDNFANAEAIASLPFTAITDTTATILEPNEPQFCLFADNSVWYSFTPTETMSVRVDTQGSAVDANVSTYLATGNGITDLQFLQCARPGISSTFLAEAGQTYYLQAASGVKGTIQVNVQQVIPPANDLFANAEVITSLPFSTAPDITDAGFEPGEPQACTNGMNQSLWYSFTPTETMSIRGSTPGLMNIYRATGTGIADLQFVNCISSSGSALFVAEAGEVYYLQVIPPYGVSGNVQVNLQQAISPGNDNFTSADVVTSLPFSTTTDISDATSESNESQYCYFMERTVWYSFTPAETMRVHADTFGSGINGNVTIFRAAGPGISDLQFLNCSGPSSSPIFTAEAGLTYYFQVGAAFGEMGNVQFNLAEMPVITGRVTDATTGAPLPGDIQPYAFVTLYRVCGDGCLEWVNTQPTDSEGRFLIDGFYYGGAALTPGTYKIEASASLYQSKQFGPFEFTGATLDLGDLPINPPAVIHGRAVDADTGDPLANATVILLRCDSGGCFEFVNSQGTDGNGQFLFNNFYYGTSLPGGTYELEFSAFLHEPKRVEVVIADGENRDLGDVSLDPIPLIGSISGRLLDNATNKPVTPTFSPGLNLFRCFDGNCFEFVNSLSPDSQGRFRFETDYNGNRLPVGTYQIIANADQYHQAQTQLITVGEAENRNIGNLRITSLPVRFSDIQPCAAIPASGGDCVFSMRLTNGMTTELEGAAWSLVDSYLPDSFSGYTNFQAKEPQGFYLDPGKSRIFRFRFNVPANSGPNGSSICTQVFVGQGSYSFFNTLGSRSLFCVYRNANGFTVAAPEAVSLPAVQSITAAATATDIEPNNSCLAAQDLGAFTETVVVDGMLDSSVAPDVDFYRFTGTAGAAILIDHEGSSTGKGTLGDPLLGFFDSNCNQLAINDDSGSLNSHLEVAIPSDGIFIVAATSYPDYGFTGGGYGTYQLTVAPIATINSISGRVTDSVNGKALRGDVAPFAFVRLLRCNGFSCNDVNSQTAGSDGRFRFETDSYGVPLRAGNYILIVSADQYQTSQTAAFTVGKDENYNAGNVALTSFPVRFSAIHPCTIPAAGGFCDFDVKVTNGLAVPLSGKAWSIINGSGIGTFTNYTIFQPDVPIDGKLNAGQSGVLHFRFYVRGAVANGAYICATVYVGQGPNALFNTVGRSSLFCFVKGSSGFTLMPAGETQTVSQQMQLQEMIQPDTQFEKKK